MKPDVRILVAADSRAEAELVAKMLGEEFSEVAVSVDPDRAAPEFDRQRPEVLVLAFGQLVRAEDYLLGLFRLSREIHELRPQTIVLCDKSELKRVYTLCRRHTFDDYVLFWPMPQDPYRLLMVVHKAARRTAQPVATAPVPQPPPEPPAMPGEAPRPPAAASRPVLLAVDDEEFQHKLLRSLLRDVDVELVFASTGREALNALRRRRPDAVLMDINLPDMDGIEVTRRIKSQDEHADIPVIMVTGHGRKDTVVQSRLAGATNFLVKPFGRDALLQRLGECLGDRLGA